MKIKFLVMALITFIISGCVSQSRLSPETRSKLNSVDVALSMPNPGIRANSYSTGTMGLGLYGAILMGVVDGIRTANAQKELNPMNNALAGFDMKNSMLSALNSNLARVNKLRLNLPAQLVLDTRKAQQASVADAILICNVSYRAYDNKLTATLYANIKEKTSNSRHNSFEDTDSFDSSIFSSSYTFEKEGITPENIRNVITEANENLAKQLADNLSK